MKKLFILLSVLCFTMCKGKPQVKDAIFVDLDKPENVSLFDYFSSIELIPLETSSGVLISAIQKMIIYKDKYYALDPRQSIIFVFDETGKFIFKLDKKGQGTGEYTFIDDFIINPFSGNLEILEAYGKIYVYDLSGNYIETKRVTFPGFMVAHTLAVLDSSGMYGFHSMFQPKKIIYFNMDKQKLLHEEFEEDMPLGSFSNPPYQYQDEWFFRPVHPVVYKMGNQKLEGVFKFDFGRYTKEGTKADFSKESERDFGKRIEEMFEQFSYIIQSVRHNNKYIFVSLLWKDEDHKANIIYDRSTGKSKFILDFTEKVLFNSYRGEEVIFTDEYVLMPVQWVDLEKRIRREMLDENQKEILEELLQSDMEQNPILIKYWFK